MKYLLAVCCFSIAIVYITALPVSNQGEDELLSSSNDGPLDRPKRTVGILRDLFPNFSQMIDRKIQQLTRIVFRIVGRLVLTGGGGGGGGGGGSDEDDDRKVSITLPTYPPDLLDNEDEDEDTTGSSSASTDGDSTTTTETTPDGEENSVAESRVNPVRAKREAPKQDLDEEEDDEGEDLESEATGDNEVSEDNEAESSELDGEEEDEEDPRNKRFLNFNLGATADAHGAGGSGSGGGSGNFLFDIIRRSADRAARMAGTVYRVLAGTDDAGLPTYQSARSLVAGSGHAPEGGEGAAAANVAVEEPKDETAYGVGVPGPLTRLFVVANKGVASLIQDLILRLAQTSEKIVNFKARLITSII